MHGVLMIVGALTLAGGVLGAVVSVIGEAVPPLWLPAGLLAVGVLGSLVWFALAGITRRLDELLGEPSSVRSRSSGAIPREPDPRAAPAGRTDRE